MSIVQVGKMRFKRLWALMMVITLATKVTLKQTSATINVTDMVKSVDERMIDLVKTAQALESILYHSLQFIEKKWVIFLYSTLLRIKNMLSKSTI